MLHKLRTRAKDEQGFTLIELLVVILIIGILAAIALPAFLGQQKKGQDADAKSDARNLVSQVETCAADNAGVYTSCTTANLTANTDKTGLNLGTGNGQVQVISTSASGYVVQAQSRSTTTFTITKSATDGVSTRTCNKPGDGGCKAVDTANGGNQW